MQHGKCIVEIPLTLELLKASIKPCPPPPLLFIITYVPLDDGEEEEEEEEDEDDLYELTSVPNGDAHSTSETESDAESQDESEVASVDSQEEDAASSQSEQSNGSANPQRAVIDDIRFVLIHHHMNFDKYNYFHLDTIT